MTNAEHIAANVRLFGQRDRLNRFPPSARRDALLRRVYAAVIETNWGLALYCIKGFRFGGRPRDQVHAVLRRLVFAAARNYIADRAMFATFLHVAVRQSLLSEVCRDDPKPWSCGDKDDAWPLAERMPDERSLPHRGDRHIDDDRLELAIGCLTPKQRSAVVGRFWGERSFEDIGADAGATKQAASCTYNAAMKRLRRMLGAPEVITHGRPKRHQCYSRRAT